MRRWQYTCAVGRGVPINSHSAALLRRIFAVPRWSSWLPSVHLSLCSSAAFLFTLAGLKGRGKPVRNLSLAPDCVEQQCVQYGPFSCFINSGGDDGGGFFSGSADSGSASASGSGDMYEGDVGGGGESEVAECVVVLPREDDEGDDLTSSTAYTAAMCSLLCMDNVTSNSLHQVGVYQLFLDCCMQGGNVQVNY